MIKKAASATHQHLSRVRYFFPFQLITLHFKKNHFLLFFWLLLFGFTTGVISRSLGVPQQFLIPEYRGENGLLSFGIVGFALGGFITAFNLYTYIMHGYRFPFIATLSRPFHKFCINNFLIPAIFILTYMWFSARIQYTKELIEPLQIAFNLSAFLFGLIVFQSLSYFYFRYTNKDAKAFDTGTGRKGKRRAPVDAPFQFSLRWFFKGRKEKRWHVETYLYSYNRIALARDSAHYDKEVLERVFFQNHINAAFFELALVVTFLLLGSLREREFFVIPAAASSLLFFTMLLMIISALHSWIRGWTLTLFMVLLIVLNYFYSDLRLFRLESRGYGMNYTVEPAKYDLETIIPDSATVRQDVMHTAGILNNWRRRVTSTAQDVTAKPKLVIIDCSGGGSRSALWTMRSLTRADSLLGGELFRHSVMITGASGGMIGASYLRELYLRKELGENVDPYDAVYQSRMALDLLNPIILSSAMNDWFIRYQTLRDGEYVYSKDRSWAFEKQLALNTGGVFDKRIEDYRMPEEEALIPMMVLTPTIINDGRRLVISSQPVSYLTQGDHHPEDRHPLHEEVEFSRLFARHDADNLRFISALRMNATFPYIFPITTLPSQPEIGIMDAGVRDNFGLKTTYRFLYAMKNWINTNTSGVIIVQVRDLPKGLDLSDQAESIFSRVMAPMGSIYGNMTRTQDYTNQQVFRYVKESFETPVDLVTLELHQDRESHISLSWHLTESEKRYIHRAVEHPFYRSEVLRLKELLGQ